MTRPAIGGELPILVVDDEYAMRGLFARALSRAGFVVLQANDGVEALELVAEHRIGVLLIDNHMPRMSGIEAVRRLRANQVTSTIPIILITGTDENGDRVLGLEAGANDFISKSTPVSEVVARVRAQLRSRFAWSEVLTRELAQRAKLVGALGNVTPQATPERTAERIVGVISERPATAFVGLLALDADGSLSPLADWAPGRGSAVGGPSLARQVSRMLVSRTSAGPWMDAVGEGLPAHAGRFDPAEVGYTATAPLMVEGRLIGLLTLGTPRGADRTGPSIDLLAAAIDYAGMASAMLGPALGSRGEESRARRRLGLVLKERAFHPVFQPVIDLNTEHVIGFEALTRFEDGTAPDVRFAEAARRGMGLPFEKAAVEEILAMSQRLPADVWLGINVSPIHVLDPQWLVALLADVRRPVLLELTEHAQVEDYRALRAALRPLIGQVQIVVDDAGAGYASMRHILELRPAFVKLDISLVRGIQADRVRQALVAGLAFFATRSGSQLIAEGIETEAEATALRELGVPLGQGYRFGRPERAETWSVPDAESGPV